MSYLLAQIFVCLLIAGLIGAVIGWFLRGGCSRKLRDCEEEWKMKIGSLESEYHSKLQRHGDKNIDKEIQAATLKRHEEHVKSATPTYSYEEELKEKLAQNTSQQQGQDTTDTKEALYKHYGIDTANMSDLEEDYDLHTLEGIDATQAQNLKNLGIHGTKDFVALKNNPDASKQIASALQVDTDQMESWIGKSCLLQLPGVNSKTAELMQNAGIKSVEHLQTSPAEELHHAMVKFNDEALIPTTVPDIKSVSLWQEIAKPLTTGAAAVGIASTKERTTMPLKQEATSYADELREKLKITPETPTGLDSVESVKELLSQRGITLNERKIRLYIDNGIDFKEGQDLDDNYDIQAIEGIGPKYAAKLKEIGLSTTQLLVEKLFKNHDAIDQVAKALQIQPDALSAWISMADLIKLPGVNGQAAEIMQTVGISSSQELAITNPHSLYSEMVSFNKKSPIVPEVPSVKAISLWSKIAKLIG